MKKINISPLRSVVFALSVSALSLSGSARAHVDIDYSIPAQLLLFNALLQPLHEHDRGHHYRGEHRRHVKHHRHGRHGHSRGHYKPRKHSHSHGGYSEKRLIKKHRKH